jgi:dethiobiotin synthetase
MKKGYFVTGTDTGVGKTLIACAMLLQIARSGLSAVGMKPVAAGCTRTDDGAFNDDVEALRAASSVQVPLEWVNPYLFDAPIAPHIAAANEGRSIDLDIIREAFRRLCDSADAIVVEGAGGFCVPLDDRHDTSDLACRLGLPVVLVVGMRLGCLNHALLTQEAIATRGLTLAGWVANCIDPGMREVQANIKTLRRKIAAPLLGTVPFMATPSAQELELLLLQCVS